MNSLDLFLTQYGLAAIFIILLLKTIGIPVPIPADLIILTAVARVAQGKLNLWHIPWTSLFSIIGHVLPLSLIALLLVVLLLTIFAIWVVVRRRRKTAQHDIEGTSLEQWYEGICPVCLALYTVNQMRSPIVVETRYGDGVQST